MGLMGALCFIDTETTGLNPFVHEAYEVAWAIEDGPVRVCRLPHTLENADPQALKVGRYFERMFQPRSESQLVNELRADLDGVTLVGSNPAFDAAFLTKTLGFAPWRHRLIDVAAGAMWVFGWDEPKGLHDVAESIRGRGYKIPRPDHTAEGDVAATRAIYRALRQCNDGTRP